MAQQKNVTLNLLHFGSGNIFGPYPYPERAPISANSQVFRKGCEALELRSTVSPLAILSFYKGTPVMACSQDFYETDKTRGFVRGYTFNAHGNRPVSLAKNLFTEAGYWGKELHDIMTDFNFYARVTMVGEVLPSINNTVALADEKDEYGLPRALATFSYGENDNKLIAHAVNKAGEILEAAWGKPAFAKVDGGYFTAFKIPINNIFPPFRCVIFSMF